MSSKYAAERLTAEIIKSTLSLLSKMGKSTVGELYVRISASLPPPLKQKLAKKGGRSEVLRLIYYLGNRGYVKRIEGRGRDALIDLTASGYRRLNELEFEPLKLEGKRWDGKWRILTFDIPEEKRPARDAIRRLIVQLGFKQLHKSVWIQPLPCREQITEIQEAYGVKDHVTLLEVNHFDQEAKFIAKFAKQIVQPKN